MTFFMLTQQNDGYSILFQRHFVNAFGAIEAIGAYGLFPVDYAQSFWRGGRRLQG
jgi:hypothetical protein